VEDIKEEAYPILQGRELYLPKRAIKSIHSLAYNRLKLNLKDYEKIFNDLRCEQFDMIATYRPYHFNGDDFGLYLYSEMFSMLVLSLIHRSSLGLRDSHTLALDSILTHGSFHYLIERYTTLVEIKTPQNQQVYSKYKRNIYSEVWGTTECYEETLANAFILKAHPFWEKKQRTIIEKLIGNQRDGYSQAIEIARENTQRIYDRLEEQLLDKSLETRDKYLRRGTMSSTKCIPKLDEYIEGNTPFRLIGLPVYLVNDCKRTEDFERIIELFFPQI
jgi:hypothetical protein